MLWIFQRASAGLLAICVLVHLFTIVYATQAGLSGADIVARLQSNTIWFGFYLLFLLSVSVHAPIGIRTVLMEHTGLPRGFIDAFALILLVALLWSGVASMLLLYRGGG